MKAAPHPVSSVALFYPYRPYKTPDGLPHEKVLTAKLVNKEEIEKPLPEIDNSPMRGHGAQMSVRLLKFQSCDSLGKSDNFSSGA